MRKKKKKERNSLFRLWEYGYKIKFKIYIYFKKINKYFQNNNMKSSTNILQSETIITGEN